MGGAPDGDTKLDVCHGDPAVMHVSRKSSAGLSLIEVLIALLIGTLLLLGLVQVFAASRTAYQLSEGLSRSQENARFAMEYLQRDIRMAGHFGCVNDQSHLQTAGALTSHFPAAPGSGIDFPVSIRGYDATGTVPGSALELDNPPDTWSPALPATIEALEPLPGSDIIVLRFLSNEGVPVNEITNPSATQTIVKVDGARWDSLTTNGVENPEMFGLADCSYADIFEAATNGVDTVTIPYSITRYTPQPAGQTMLYRAESLVYYVGTSGTTGEPALFRARSNDAGVYASEELVEGIENLQFMYGLDRVTALDTTPPSGYIEVHQPASGIANTALAWRRVGMVQVGMLAVSPNPAAAPQPEDDERYRRALGVEFQPPAVNDTHYRAAYEATVALRNRLYGN